jgi:hypothetical protein
VADFSELSNEFYENREFLDHCNNCQMLKKIPHYVCKSYMLKLSNGGGYYYDIVS